MVRGGDSDDSLHFRGSLRNKFSGHKTQDYILLPEPVIVLTDLELSLFLKDHSGRTTEVSPSGHPPLSLHRCVHGGHQSRITHRTSLRRRTLHTVVTLTQATHINWSPYKWVTSVYLVSETTVSSLLPPVSVRRVQKSRLQEPTGLQSTQQILLQPP